MRAVEVTGTIDREGHLLLDQPFEEDISSRVRVIVLFSDPVQELEDDPDDTPIEEVKASLKRAFQQAKAGQTRPISILMVIITPNQIGSKPAAVIIGYNIGAVIRMIATGGKKHPAINKNIFI